MIFKTTQFFFVFPFAPKRAFHLLGEHKPTIIQVILITILVAVGLLILYLADLSYLFDEINKKPVITYSISIEFGIAIGFLFQIIVYSAFVFAINSRWKKDYDFKEIYFYVTGCFFPLLIFLHFPKTDFWLIVKVLSTIWFLLLLASVIHFKLKFSKLRSFAIAFATYFLVTGATMMLRGIEI